MVELVEDILPQIPPLGDALEQAMPFAVQYRYPHEPIELAELEEQAVQAVATMRQVRAIVRKSLGLQDELRISNTG